MSLRTYHSAYGYDGTGAKEQMVAMVQEIKASPETGKKRLIVREKDKRISHNAIDIDIKNSKEIKEKQTYVFEVNEKDDSRNPGFQRKRSSEFRSYHCHDKPEVYSPDTEMKMAMNRFGGGGPSGSSGRTRFS